MAQVVPMEEMVSSTWISHLTSAKRQTYLAVQGWDMGICELVPVSQFLEAKL